MDNVDVAILSKFNECAEKYGVKPYEFVATLKYDAEAKNQNYTLVVEAGNPLSDPTFNKMIDRIQKKLPSGILENSTMKGDGKELYEAIEFALSKAPELSKKHQK